jgi:hypothetical protein
MSKHKENEYGKALPTDIESMEIGKTYWDDASDYGLLRETPCSLYIVRKEHFFMTAPDEFSEITKWMDFDYSCQSHVSGKLFIGFTKGKCSYPQDSIKRVAYYMKHDAGIEEFQIKQFDSMMDALNFIKENKLEAVAG